MYNALKYTLIFSLGAVAGVTASWKIFETKYKKIAQEEIDSVKETYAKKTKNHIEDDVVEEPLSDLELARAEMKSLIDDYVGEGGSETMDFSAPYVIAPEEFDELEGYESRSLTYYSDGVLTDEQNAIVDIGIDPKDHFGEYEDDSVFVRDDFLKCDYEILMDLRTYSDAEETFLMPNND
jgi:hypothetical protein